MKRWTTGNDQHRCSAICRGRFCRGKMAMEICAETISEESASAGPGLKAQLRPRKSYLC